MKIDLCSVELLHFLSSHLILLQSRFIMPSLFQQSSSLTLLWLILRNFLRFLLQGTHLLHLLVSYVYSSFLCSTILLSLKFIYLFYYSFLVLKGGYFYPLFNNDVLQNSFLILLFFSPYKLFTSSFTIAHGLNWHIYLHLDSHDISDSRKTRNGVMFPSKSIFTLYSLN